MSKAAKVLAKIMAGKSDRNVSFDEAVYVLTRCGFVQDGGKGSHQIYRHQDGRKIVLPYHGKDIKPVYIRQIRELLK
jgi:predicted RNA binding protein YcfA (HicA-like mRNA interferase family)